MWRPLFATVLALKQKVTEKGAPDMPVITIDLGTIENKEQKALLVQALTEAASSVTQIPADKFIVLIKELERENIGVGGKLLSDILK
jgi:4-oxalocrotonate tautomerase